MSDTEESSTSQGELSRSFSMLPERQAKVATLVSMMEKSPKASVKGHGDGKKDKEFKGHSDGRKDKEVKRELKEEMKEESEDPEIFCICRTTDSTSFMICCDFCEEWFHGRCVNIAQEISKNIKRYACPPCQAKDPLKHKTLYKEKRDKIGIKSDTDKEKEKEKMKDRHKDKKKKKKKKLSKEKMKKKKKKMKPSHSRKHRGEGGSRYVHRSARRCGNCAACHNKRDCGKCDFCKDMKKFGGPNKIRQKCRLKQCIKLSHLVKRGYRSSPGTPGTPGTTESERQSIWDSTTSIDTDTDRLLKILKSKKPSKSTTSKLKDFKKRTGLGVPLIDHYDYSKRPEEDPEYIKKMEEEKRLREEKKERERQERETLKQLRLEERRRSSRISDKFDDDGKRRKLDDAKSKKQCSGPACVNAARSGSKYCSDDCGMKLATTRIFEFLPQRIQQWQQKPCIAEETNKKQLEEMRRQMEEAKRKIAELDKKIVQLRQIIERAKKIPIADTKETSEDSEEAELSIYCVSCGHPVAPTRALRHMSKCYSKYETQTSYGSAFKTRIVGESMFCDFFNASQNTYCKRLKVLCPEHTKEPKIPEKEVCGCPLIADVFKETKAYCQLAKRKCYKHHNWEKLRRAEIDLERVRWWLKLDDLLEQERNIRMSMSTRAGVLGLMLHQTIDHTLLMPPPVMPAQPMQGTPGEQSNGVKQETAVAEAQQNGQMQQLPVSTAQQNRPMSQALTTNTATPVTASA